MNNYYIKWLGGLEIFFDDEVSLKFKSKKSQIKDLLGILLFMADSNLTDEQIIKMIWPKGNVENGQGALKNLVYLTRKSLKVLSQEDTFIIRKNGRYIWNPKLKYSMDTDIVDEYYKILISVNTKEALKLEMGRNIIDMYQGKISENYSSGSWWFPVDQYFNMIYINAVRIVCKILEEKNDRIYYKEIIEIAMKATKNDIENVALYTYIFRALKALGDKKSICDYYEALSSLLQERLSEGFCDEIKNIYTWATITPDYTFTDLSKLIDNLRENSSLEEIKGSYYCDRDTFKNIFHFVMRNKLRERKDVVLILVTLKNYKTVKLDASIMIELKNIISKSLRRNDLFVKYSVNQYLILPYKCKKESAEKIKIRLEESFVPMDKDVYIEAVGFCVGKEEYELIL
ncbi:MAG TPA: hypothetical protein VJ916_05065 [Anaerovoracaceae bacterium]|nr:hypothetical protein [Anaerovoracaceae bacterium]